MVTKTRNITVAKPELLIKAEKDLHEAQFEHDAFFAKINRMRDDPTSSYVIMNNYDAERKKVVAGLENTKTLYNYALSIYNKRKAESKPTENEILTEHLEGLEKQIEDLKDIVSQQNAVHVENKNNKTKSDQPVTSYVIIGLVAVSIILIFN